MYMENKLTVINSSNTYVALCAMTTNMETPVNMPSNVIKVNTSTKRTATGILKTSIPKIHLKFIKPKIIL